MQSCLEDNPSLVESTSVPLVVPSRHTFDESRPAWTIRFSRPANDRNQLVQELRGVPKAALRQVFGKHLGTRLWQRNRAANPAGSVPAESTDSEVVPLLPTPATATASDREISGGMLVYLCAEASATLLQRKRLAKSISLTALHSDGKSETVRQSLPFAANDAKALETAARAAIAGMRSDKFVSLKLDLIAMPAQA
jgi:nucleotidyltransferase/DNA polymerase involved in DNA repair